MIPQSDIQKTNNRRLSSLIGVTFEHKGCGEAIWDEDAENLVCKTCGHSASVPLKYLPSKWKYLLVIPIAYSLLIFTLYFIKFGSFGGGLSSDQAIWGQFGDYVGGLLNPTFSLAALVAVIYTLRFNADSIRISAKAVSDAKDSQMKQAISEAQSNCFKMHELWLSDHMRRNRETAHPPLVRLKKADLMPANGTRRLVSTPTGEELPSIEVVCHFFRDITIFLEEGLIDPVLAIKLFKEDVDHWIPMTSLVDFGDNKEWYQAGAGRAQEVFEKHATMTKK